MLKLEFDAEGRKPGCWYLAVACATICVRCPCGAAFAVPAGVRVDDAGLVERSLRCPCCGAARTIRLRHWLPTPFGTPRKERRE